ncbi:MAG: hypothetical protein ACR2KS_04735 [Candidatus Eremiobacter antarcticus]|nr:hypothetical protein [Candidatus Eremiobacteraeota bacterium]MBC5807326.1 hypothetical protein [Candidatus Eremiobacteraeota bacterium]
MKDRSQMPGQSEGAERVPNPDVPSKPHEFPEYEDTPTDLGDDTGRKIDEGTEDPGSDDEQADITNE